jgi:hypothetical protein
MATRAIIFKPPISLNALSDDAVEEITNLLQFDSSENSSRKTNEWRHRQENKVAKLKNGELLRPDSLIYRGYMKLFRRQTLCPAHKELDHRVIRSILWNIAYESTAQTNIYRVLRVKGRLSFNLERHSWMTKENLKLIDEEEDTINGNMDEWMDLTNEITALWLGEKTYRKLCCSKEKDFLPECAKTGCEACMLAAVGGNCHYLTALRASLLARHLYKKTKSKDKKKKIDPPSLLRVIDAWVSKVHDSRNKPLIIGYSQELARSLVGMRTLARRLEDEEIERRRKKGKRPQTRWGAAMVTWTDDKLPVPIQHVPRKKPARDVVRIDWTTELTQSFRKAVSKDKIEASSVKISGAIQTKDNREAASEARFSSLRGSTDSAQDTRRSDPKGTRTHINFNCNNGDVPGPHLSPPSAVGLQESESSWTSQVVDDDEEDDDDIYDDDRRFADNDAVDAAHGGVNETELSINPQPEGYVVSPEGSSIYSGDERDEEGNHDVAFEPSSVHSGDKPGK